MMKLRRLGLAAAVTLASLTGLSAPTLAQDGELTPLTFSLDFIPLGRHAPWYTALGKGFFEEEGLDVTIIPAQGTAQVIQAVESGTAQLGFVDVPALALARSNGSQLRMIAVNYQKAPYAIFTLANGADVTEISQLEGLTLGSGAGSFTPKIIKGYMTENGLDPDALEITNVAPPARAGMLLSGNVPAIEFFVMAQPGLANGAVDAGTELRTLLLGDHGLELYSNGIATTEDYLAANPDVAKRFVRAALKGWQYALNNPEEAADIQLQYIESLDRDTIIAEIGVVRSLAVTEDTEMNGLGWFDKAKMQTSLDFVLEFIGVEGDEPDAADLYAEGFLPDEPIKP
ncbi:ABC transporter substrate-binding protein [Cucumibacter marinus]|uniref:ABC transporter substrate-binding protein n=1 Tax=Cucumibacter marinus TaxID=1121252 RepID=UPI0003F8E54A|nr:ABC transporter substrate-binding protein [Cucumibacter marinus]